MEWVQCIDDQGQTYYYNNLTHESAWEAPEALQVEGHNFVNEETNEEKEALTNGQSSWTQIKDSSTGEEYYVNNESGETQWNRPNSNETLIISCDHTDVNKPGDGESHIEQKNDRPLFDSNSNNAVLSHKNNYGIIDNDDDYDDTYDDDDDDDDDDFAKDVLLQLEQTTMNNSPEVLLASNLNISSELKEVCDSKELIEPMIERSSRECHLNIENYDPIKDVVESITNTNSEEDIIGDSVNVLTVNGVLETKSTSVRGEVIQQPEYKSIYSNEGSLQKLSDPESISSSLNGISEDAITRNMGDRNALNEDIECSNLRPDFCNNVLGQKGELTSMKYLGNNLITESTINKHDLYIGTLVKSDHPIQKATDLDFKQCILKVESKQSKSCNFGNRGQMIGKLTFPPSNNKESELVCDHEETLVNKLEPLEHQPLIGPSSASTSLSGANDQTESNRKDMIFDCNLTNYSAREINNDGSNGLNKSKSDKGNSQITSVGKLALMKKIDKGLFIGKSFHAMKTNSNSTNSRSRIDPVLRRENSGILNDFKLKLKHFGSLTKKFKKKQHIECVEPLSDSLLENDESISNALQDSTIEEAIISDQEKLKHSVISEHIEEIEEDILIENEVDNEFIGQIDHEVSCWNRETPITEEIVNSSFNNQKDPIDKVNDCEFEPDFKVGIQVEDDNQINQNPHCSGNDSTINGRFFSKVKLNGQSKCISSDIDSVQMNDFGLDNSSKSHINLSAIDKHSDSRSLPVLPLNKVKKRRKKCRSHNQSLPSYCKSKEMQKIMKQIEKRKRDSKHQYKRWVRAKQKENEKIKCEVVLSEISRLKERTQHYEIRKKNIMNINESAEKYQQIKQNRKRLEQKKLQEARWRMKQRSIDVANNAKAKVFRENILVERVKRHQNFRQLKANENFEKWKHQKDLNG